MQQVLKTYKQAFKNISRCTIYIINRYLQAYVFKDMGEHRRFFKAIQMGGRNSIVYAIFQDAKEYCKPTFTSIHGAAKAQYQQRLIYMPIFYDGLLMFAVQLESDAPANAGAISGLHHSPTVSPSKKSPSKMTSGLLSRTKTISMRSQNKTQSKMSDAVSKSWRTGALRNLWSHNDHTVCKIIAELAKSRMQIFTYNIQR